MNWHYVTPIATSLTTAAVIWVCSRAHHRAFADADVFFIPSVVGYAIGAIGVGVCTALVLIDAPLRVCSAFLLGYSLAALFFLRYRITVTKDAFTLRGLRRRTFRFADVADTHLATSGGRQLTVQLCDGRFVRLSGLVGDFDELVDLIESRMVPPPDGGRDLEIWERFTRRWRRAKLIAAAGVFITGVSVWLYAIHTVGFR
jgi:hypothetical protein